MERNWERERETKRDEERHTEKDEDRKRDIREERRTRDMERFEETDEKEQLLFLSRHAESYEESNEEIFEGKEDREIERERYLRISETQVQECGLASNRSETKQLHASTKEQLSFREHQKRSHLVVS